jgi:putative DNA primase/helicase
MDAAEMTESDLLALAAEHTAAGMPSLPVVLIEQEDGTTAKIPATRGRRGYLDATVDVEEFLRNVAVARRIGADLAAGRRWCIGIGVVPGDGDAIVLDCDVKHDSRGLETLEMLKARYGDEIDAVRWRSISGGVNLALRKPRRRIGNRMPKDWVDIDVRADSGFVVAPGTWTPWGGWVWEQGEWSDLGAMPDEMAAELPDASPDGKDVPPVDRDEAVDFLAGSPRTSSPAAQTAFNAKLTELQAMTTGNRHPKLVEVIGWTFGMRALNLDEAMRDIDTVWGGLLKPDEVRRRSGEAWEVAHWVAEREIHNRTIDQATTDSELSSPLEWSDAHVGEAFAEQFGEQWCYVTAWKKWMRWDGRRWAADTTEAIHEAARKWVIAHGVKMMSTPGDNSADLKKVLGYKRKGAIENIVAIARRIVAVEPSAFDTHPHLLNARNGTIDLRTGRLLDHGPALMLTKLADAEYEPDAAHVDVNSVLECMTPAVQETMSQLLGAAASGVSGSDLLAVFDGSGANGKTTVLLAASGALGDYADPIPAPLVMSTGRDEHPHVYETLRGLRLAYIEETEEDGGLRLERVKALTGGAPIQARPMGGSYYTFEPTHSLVIATNHRPIVNSAEYAIWRRLKLIPFPYTYGTESHHRPIDPGLRIRVAQGAAQRSAMLAWIVNGAIVAYRNGGGAVPVIEWCEEIIAATAEWKAAEDVIGRFIAERIIVFDSPARQEEKGTAVFAAYKEWCQDEGRPAGQAKNFHRKFEAHIMIGTERRFKQQNAVWYSGIEVRGYTSS